MHGITLFAGSANRPLAESVAGLLGVAPGACIVERFPDGEVSVRLEESVRGREVFVLQPTSPPVNDHPVERLAFADACRRAAPGRRHPPSEPRRVAARPALKGTPDGRRIMWRETVFEDRSDAGRRLAARLGAYAGRDDVLVLALPRGGVPVGFEVARAIGAPLDVMIVRKLGVPGHEELAMGAVAGGGVRVLDAETVRMLRIPPRLIDEETRRERAEVERRERVYRGGRPAPVVRGRTVLLVDDGIATGSTVRAAIAALRAQGPARVVVAVPTAPASTCELLSREADEVVCLSSPEPYVAISQWYEDFPQLTDEEVREVLGRAAEPRPPAGSRA